MHQQGHELLALLGHSVGVLPLSKASHKYFGMLHTTKMTCASFILAETWDWQT